MTNEELVERIQAGETELYLPLWEQVKKFIRKMAMTWPHTGAVDLDDLNQSGYLALVSAVETYSPERDCSFVGWLALHLKTAFSEASGRRSKKQQKDPIHQADSLNRPLDQEEADRDTLGDLIADPCGLQGLEDVEMRIWLEQLHTALDRALAALPEEQSDVLRRRYYQGQTLAEAAQDLGVRLETIRTRGGKALRGLRKPRLSRELLAFATERTDYYAHGSVAQFQRTGESTVERAVFQREQLAKKYGKGPNF